jgi:hypothetical protein
MIPPRAKAIWRFAFLLNHSLSNHITRLVSLATDKRPLFKYYRENGPHKNIHSTIRMHLALPNVFDIYLNSCCIFVSRLILFLKPNRPSAAPPSSPVTPSRTGRTRFCKMLGKLTRFWRYIPPTVRVHKPIMNSSNKREKTN